MADFRFDFFRSKQEIADRDHHAGLRYRFGSRRGALELGQRNHEILFLMRLVALETGGDIGFLVWLLVGGEHLVFPFAVAQIVLVLGAPAGALFHDGVGNQVALLELAIRPFDRSALVVDLGLVLHQRQYRSAGNRLSGLDGIDGRLG